MLPFDYLVPGTKNTALRNPRDMAGLKMRGLGRVNLAMLQGLGATPVSLNFVELSPAIQQGVIDGLNVPTDNYLIYKWNESIKHVTYATYYVAFYPWMVNAKWWASVPADLRTIIEDTAIEVAMRHRDRAQQRIAEGDRGMKCGRRQRSRADAGRARRLDRGDPAGVETVRSPDRPELLDARAELFQMNGIARAQRDPGADRGRHRGARAGRGARRRRL